MEQTGREKHGRLQGTVFTLNNAVSVLLPGVPQYYCTPSTFATFED